MSWDQMLGEWTGAARPPSKSQYKTPNLLMGLSGRAPPVTQRVYLLSFPLCPLFMPPKYSVWRGWNNQLHHFDSSRDFDLPSDVFVLGRCLFLGPTWVDRFECGF